MYLGVDHEIEPEEFKHARADRRGDEMLTEAAAEDVRNCVERDMWVREVTEVREAREAREVRDVR